MPTPTPDQLREHLAYEVHYLALAAVGYVHINGVEGGVYQDSSLLHARNLLDFTNPGQRTSHTWWIGDVGGQKPPRSDRTHDDWREFINANATHFGPGRLEARQSPFPDDKQRYIDLARYLLKRIATFSENSGNLSASIMQTLAQYGLAYLDDPSADNLRKLARAIDGPL